MAFSFQPLDYANGDSVEYTYNKYGQLRKQVYEDGAKVIYRYDNSGALAQVEDYATGILTKYMYDLSDRLMMYEEEAGEQNHRVRYYYDSMNNLTKVREGFDGVNRTTTYTYDKDNRVTGVSQSDTSEAYTYDDYGRFRKATLTHGENLTLEDIYTYQAPTDATTAMQVYKQTTKINGEESAYRYTYDANGNITSVNDGTYTTTYVYDSANQLLRENNEKAGKTWGWTYDDGGNIRSKKEYAYTTGTPGTALDTTEYSYSTSSWGDLLISHDGNTIVSDNSGNMLSYGDEKTFTWKHGRELSQMTDGSGTWSFEYNADGLRVYRSNGTTEYKYYYNGDKLSRMVVNGENITFGYDANGTPQYVLYGGNRYFYLTNLQGDVTAIVSVNGNIVVEYTYDAWGNVLSIEGVRKDNLGKLNPLRYRGYVYDEETGLYYLQSRYYDPEIGRFINADGYTSTGQGFVGNNMFAYCNNSPVCLVDPTGNIAKPYSRDLVGYGGAEVGIPFLPFGLLEEIANDVKTWVESQEGKKENRNNSVYVLKDPSDHNLVKYVGRTNAPGRREGEHHNDPAHSWRKGYQMTVLVTGLTKNEAMLWEQLIISAYTVDYLENARREISVRNVPKFRSYVNAVTEIHTGMSGSDVIDFITRR